MKAVLSTLYEFLGINDAFRDTLFNMWPKFQEFVPSSKRNYQIVVIINKLSKVYHLCYTQLRWMDPIELRMLYYKSKWAIAPKMASQFLISDLLISRMVNRGAIGTYRNY